MSDELSKTGLKVKDIPWIAEPWLPYQATELLRRIRPKTVFEWGAGGSTLFFVGLGARCLVSVEHQPDWFRAVGQELAKGDWSAQSLGSSLLELRRINQDVEFSLVPPEPGDVGPDKADPAHYKSGSTELGPCNFRAYASFIDWCEPFDLVLVDGMARASCIAHAAPKVKPGGWLVIDDTNRPYYLEKTGHLFGDYASGWERIDVLGYGPILAYQKQTTFFHNVRLKNYGR